MKFKVGDRIITNYKAIPGFKGTIEKVKSGDKFCCKVKWDIPNDYSHHDFHYSYLKKLTKLEQALE